MKGSRRWVRPAMTVAVLALAVAALSAERALPTAADGCGDLPVSVDCGVGTDPPDGQFHGLIGVTGEHWVLDVASRSGTSPGCGDCVWTITLDCPESSPQQSDPAGCGGMSAGYQCPPDALPYRLYLTTSSITDEVVGTICLGGSHRVVLVGEDAQADVDRYLHDVAPPDLAIHRRPHGPTLTGLATYFAATVPPMDPVTFGSADVSETIALVPEQVDWTWDDGVSSGWQPVGATAMHRYLSSGVVPGTLTTRWGATYTATFEGRTVGPFRAIGTLDHVQPFVEQVDTSSPVLVGPPEPQG